MFESKCILSICPMGDNRVLVELEIHDGLMRDIWKESLYSSRGSMSAGDAILAGELHDSCLSCEGKSVYGLVGLPRSNAWRKGAFGRAYYLGGDPVIRAAGNKLLWKITDVRHI